MPSTSISTFPPALSPWAPWLDLFPRPSALAIGPLIQRLDTAIGPLRVSPLAGSVEPDGFDGLARRGLPERLLISEWLLLEEAPMEFLRRASEGEQSYLRLARRDPHVARSSFALFDCGPSQVGSPRLGQLAALIVLSRRAEAAGAKFGWGIWQKPGDIRLGVTREDVEWWLNQRGEGDATSQDGEIWSAFVASFSTGATADEKWLIGNAGLREMGVKGANYLMLADELDPFAENKAISVQIYSNGLAPREFRLELPEDDTCARLIREPFTDIAPKVVAQTTAPTGLQPTSNLVWGTGFKLLARGEQHSLVTYPVPNSPQAKAGKAKSFRGYGSSTIIAAGRVNRATVCVSMYPNGKDNQLQIEAWGRSADALPLSPITLPDYKFLEHYKSLPNWPLGQVFAHGSRGVAVLTPNGYLLAITPTTSGEDSRIEVRDNVLAAASENGVVHYARRTKDALIIEILGRPPGSPSIPNLPSSTQAFTGWRGYSRGRVWACSPDGHEWTIRQGQQEHQLYIPHGQSVRGGVATIRGQLALVVIGQNKRDLILNGHDFTQRLHTFSSPITHVSVSCYEPLMSIQTENGEISVYSFSHENFVMRLGVKE